MLGRVPTVSHAAVQPFHRCQPPLTLARPLRRRLLQLLLQHVTLLAQRLGPPLRLRRLLLQLVAGHLRGGDTAEQGWAAVGRGYGALGTRMTAGSTASPVARHAMQSSLPPLWPPTIVQAPAPHLKVDLGLALGHARRIQLQHRLAQPLLQAVVGRLQGCGHGVGKGGLSA